MTKIKTSALDELQSTFHKLPLFVMQDIDKRVGDWLAMGGNEDDPYIYQQLRFAKNVMGRDEE